jgi:hypothetical protein
MPTQSNQFLSRTIFQFADDEINDISWVIQPEMPVGTQRDLSTTVNTSTGLHRNRTWYITYSNFAFDNTVPRNITGIELRTTTSRRGRCHDETICLSYDDQLISDNLTQYLSDDMEHLYINDSMVYGGPGNLWGLRGYDINSVVRDPLFGITMRFHSHPMYPHRDPMVINSILISFYGE